MTLVSVMWGSTTLRTHTEVRRERGNAALFSGVSLFLYTVVGGGTIGG